MTFDEWWESYKSENKQYMYENKLVIARAAWNAALRLNPIKSGRRSRQNRDFERLIKAWKGLR